MAMAFVKLGDQSILIISNRFELEVVLLCFPASFIFVQRGARVFLQRVFETINRLVRVVHCISRRHCLHPVWANRFGERADVKLEILRSFFVEPAISADVLVLVPGQRAPLLWRLAALLRQVVLEEGKRLFELVLLVLLGLVEARAELAWGRAVVEHIWIAADSEGTPTDKLGNRTDLFVMRNRFNWVVSWLPILGFIPFLPLAHA